MTWTPDEDWEPDDEDLPDQGSETVPCRYCGEEIYEDAQRCPKCGQYLSAEDSRPNRRPTWFIVTAIICLIFVVMWIVNR